MLFGGYEGETGRTPALVSPVTGLKIGVRFTEQQHRARRSGNIVGCGGDTQLSRVAV